MPVPATVAGVAAWSAHPRSAARGMFAAAPRPVRWRPREARPAC